MATDENASTAVVIDEKKVPLYSVIFPPDVFCLYLCYCFLCSSFCLFNTSILINDTFSIYLLRESYMKQCLEAIFL